MTLISKQSEITRIGLGTVKLDRCCQVNGPKLLELADEHLHAPQLSPDIIVVLFGKLKINGATENLRFFGMWPEGNSSNLPTLSQTVRLWD